MPKQTIDLHELFQYVLLEAHAAWRYRWHALILAWCIAIVGALLVFSLPNKYESKAQVYADTNALTNPLLHGLTVHPNVNQRLQIITRTVLSTPNLETVADKTGLSLRASTPAGKSALLARLGHDVHIRNAGTRNLYNISYSDPDPNMAQKVVQAFVQILMSDTTGANTASNTSAQNFLQQQVQDYAKQLNQRDKEIAEFKNANSRYLPSAGGGDYATRLQAAQSKLQDLQIQYNALNSGAPGAVRRANPQIQELDQQIAAYQAQLNKLLLTYTDEYPGVVSARRIIKRLQARRDNLLKHPGSAPTEVVPSVPTAGQTTARMLSAEIAAQKQRIADLQKNAGKDTQAQVTFQKLTRNYQATKKQYDLLVARLNTANLSQESAQSGNNLKFQVIDPPVVPIAPVSPKRGLFLLAVFVLAIAIGAAFAWFLHKVRPVFVSLRSLKDFSDYPVIGAVSLIVSETRRQVRRRQLIGFFSGVGLLVLVVLLGFAFSGILADAVQHIFVMGPT